MQTPFRWANVSIEVLQALIEHPEASPEDAAAELTLLYGAPPKADFVADRWPVLRDAWLAVGDDPHTADTIVALRTAGLGDLSIATTTAGGTASYLASCADSMRLRSIVLRGFLAAGRPTGDSPSGGSASGAVAVGATVSGDAPEAEVAADDVGERGIVHARDADELREAVVVALGSLVGSGSDGGGEVVVDDDGDIPIRWGSAVLYVRVIADNPIIRIFSPLLREVHLSDDLRDAVNELNKNHLFASAFWADGVVLLTADLFAAPFVPQQFLNLLHAVAETADSIDDQLRSRFSVAGPNRPGAAGYL
jgi:hypothetical protein